MRKSARERANTNWGMGEKEEASTPTAEELRAAARQAREVGNDQLAVHLEIQADLIETS